jgi:hypothetical protein
MRFEVQPDTFVDLVQQSLKESVVDAKLGIGNRLFCLTSQFQDRVHFGINTNPLSVPLERYDKGRALRLRPVSDVHES